MAVTGVLDGLERDSVRMRFEQWPASPPREVAVVGIDDPTFGRLNARWPLRRSLHARAIDRLRAAGARAIVYDIQFTEPTTAREDGALLAAVHRAGNVVLATTETDDRGRTNVLGGDDVLARAHARAAASNLTTDPDGVFERFDATSGGLVTLASAAARAVGGPRLPRAAFGHGGAWIDFRGPPGTIPTYSFADLVEGRIDPRALRGRIVVVGATAPTLQDLHPTPVSSVQLMSGAELQANAIWTALHGVPLRPAPGWMSLLALALLGVAPALAALRLRAVAATALAAALGGAYVALAVVAFDAGTILPVVAPLTALTAGAAATVAAGYAAERRARDRAISRGDDLELEVVFRLARAAESRDTDTGEHVDRMSRICHRLGRVAGLAPEEAGLLRHASALHDIGKISVPDAILRKPGPLDRAEWEVMKAHTTTGADLLAGSTSALLQMAELIALTHHERWDGTGYPAGLGGDAIPLVGRICALADVFDALVSERPYKPAWTVDDALAEIAAQASRHFDPRLTRLMLELEPWLRADHEALRATAEAAPTLVA